MIIGFIFTLLIGLFFLIGIIFLRKNSHKEQLEIFTISLASIVLLGLLLFDLLPELMEANNYLLILPALLGFIILILLDKLIPHHHHEHTDNKCDRKDHEEHLNHIGIVTIIALSIHNMIEGLTLYNITVNNLKSGFLMMIAIALHNIPLGFQIGNYIKDKKYNGGLYE